MNTYTWNITNLRSNDDGGVTFAKWSCDAVTSEGLSYTAEGHREYTPNSSEADYTAFKDLSEAEVLGWIWRFVNKEKMQEHCDAVLRYMAASRGNETMPWLNAAEASANESTPE